MVRSSDTINLQGASIMMTVRPSIHPWANRSTYVAPFSTSGEVGALL